MQSKKQASQFKDEPFSEDVAATVEIQVTKLFMNTHEVADYLRIKERKVYELVSQRQIPCTRIAGKWLFSKELIDLWLLHHTEGSPQRPIVTALPDILAGSHDPLLDWAIRESGSELAVLFNGSLDGLERVAKREALGCGLHVLDPDSGDYNTPLLAKRFSQDAIVALQWAWREQGLIVAPGNPLSIKTVADLVGKRCAVRQKEAGSHILLTALLQQQGLELSDLITPAAPLRSETDVALAITSGETDAGLGIAAVAQLLKIDFVPLTRERYDLVFWQRSYFEPPIQKLMAFTRSTEFAKRAQELGGYDISGLGTVRYNGSG